MYETLTRDFELIVDREKTVLSQTQIYENLNRLKKDFNVKPFWDYIEHTSANPTGRLHFANLLQSLCGDLFCRLNNLKGTYFVNDSGYNYYSFYHQIKQKIKNIGVEHLSLDLIDLCYNIPEPDVAAEVQDLRKKYHSMPHHTSKETEVLLFYVLELISEQMKNANIKEMCYVHEKDFLIQAVKILVDAKNGLLKPNFKFLDGCLFYETKDLLKVRLSTAQGAILYAFTDYLYRKHINSKYDRPVILLGPGNKKAHDDVEKMTEKEWALINVPKVKYEGISLSKRKKHTIYYEDLLKMIKSNSVAQSKNLIRLWVYQNINNSILDLSDLKSDSYITHLKKILYVEKKSDNDFVLKNINFKILNNGEFELLTLWAQIDRILHLISRSLDANKVVKLLERLYSLRKQIRDENVKNIDLFFFEKLKLFLGFLD